MAAWWLLPLYTYSLYLSSTLLEDEVPRRRRSIYDAYTEIMEIAGNAVLAIEAKGELNWNTFSRNSPGNEISRSRNAIVALRKRIHERDEVECAVCDGRLIDMEPHQSKKLE